MFQTKKMSVRVKYLKPNELAQSLAHPNGPNLADAQKFKADALNSDITQKHQR